MEKWYQKSYRRNLVDMHIEDWNPEFLSAFDSRKYVELMKVAHVQTAMIYANSHIGLCYWPTQSGQMHAGLGGRDMLAEVLGEIRKQGMDPVLYYSLIYNNWAYEKNPEWRMIDVNGLPSRDPRHTWSLGDIHGGRYGHCCPNNQGYRDFVAKQIAEFSVYDFVGIFYDMCFWPTVCYCQSCRNRYKEETGGEIPEVIDWDDPRWQDFQDRREKWLAEFALFVTLEQKKHKPECIVEHQFSVIPQFWRFGSTIRLLPAVDVASGDFYGGYLQQSFVCKLYHSITPLQPFEYMTSRCYPDLMDHTTTKTKEMIAAHNYLTLAHNGAFLFIDAIDPKGTMNPRVYQMLGDVFQESARYEPFLGGDLQQDIAIYFSTESKMDLNDSGKRADASTGQEPHIQAGLNVAKILGHSHIPYGVISSPNLHNIATHQVLVLPDLLHLSDEEAALIGEYVAAGGSLYASGPAVLDKLSHLLGIRQIGQTQESYTYMAPTPAGQPIFGEVNENWPLSVFGSQSLVEIEPDVEVLATITLPYTDPADFQHIASIHSNPPGIKTSWPAMIRRQVGQGRIIWVAAPIEKFSQPDHMLVMTRLLKSLAVKPLSFKSEAPPAIEILRFDQPGKILLNILNIQEVLPPVTAHQIKISVRLDGRQPMSAVNLPERTPLTMQIAGDFCEIEIPPVELFQMVTIEFSQEE